MIVDIERGAKVFAGFDNRVAEVIRRANERGCRQLGQLSESKWWDAFTG